MHVGQRIGQAARREDPGRHRLFQKRRERSARAVMVPKTPGEKPPGPTLSQAQAGAGSGRSPGDREIFGFCASSSWKKRSAKRSVEGEDAGSAQGYDRLQARHLSARVQLDVAGARRRQRAERAAPLAVLARERGVEQEQNSGSRHARSCRLGRRDLESHGKALSVVPNRDALPLRPAEAMALHCVPPRAAVHLRARWRSTGLFVRRLSTGRRAFPSRRA